MKKLLLTLSICLFSIFAIAQQHGGHVVLGGGFTRLPDNSGFESGDTKYNSVLAGVEFVDQFSENGKWLLTYGLSYASVRNDMVEGQVVSRDYLYIPMLLGYNLSGRLHIHGGFAANFQIEKVNGFNAPIVDALFRTSVGLTDKLYAFGQFGKNLSQVYEEVGSKEKSTISFGVALRFTE
jgi:hypothetical protein